MKSQTLLACCLLLLVTVFTRLSAGTNAFTINVICSVCLFCILTLAILKKRKYLLWLFYAVSAFPIILNVIAISGLFIFQTCHNHDKCKEGIIKGDLLHIVTSIEYSRIHNISNKHNFVVSDELLSCIKANESRFSKYGVMFINTNVQDWVTSTATNDLLFAVESNMKNNLESQILGLTTSGDLKWMDFSKTREPAVVTITNRLYKGQKAKAMK